MKKFLTLFAVAALFSAVACGEAKKDTSNAEDEAKDLMEEMNSSMDEVIEVVEEAVMDSTVTDSTVTDSTIVEEATEEAAQ
ncbi:MAG: hypothetical protein JKY48_11685 [Flavobacteriales bacterium]|nr:hypothetical protein [Flavobacteriales bacterium]